MRMRKRNNLEPRMEACSAIWIRNGKELRGAWRSLMPEAKEVRLEVGCGKGKFTVETAALEPDVLFVAVERVQEALVLAMEKALSMGLKNVYFLSIDAAKLEEQEARHAARKQPAEQEAVPQRCHDAAVDPVNEAVLQYRHDARPDAAQPRIAAVHQPAVGRALHGGLPAEQAAQCPAGQRLRKRAVDRRKHPRQERAVVQGRKRREQPPEQTGPQQLIHEASPWR